METLVEYASAELEIKKSRFLAEVFPVVSQTEARSLLKQQKEKYEDATHVVHGFVLGPAAEILGMSDDGEPAGTAGWPVLDVLKGRNCTNILLTVTRWFGGTLLGTGGLVKAYGDSAKAAIITRGMAEITRLGLAMGGQAQTFAGLAGVGDLIVTATSLHSRNNRCGMLMGQGKSPAVAVQEVGMVVEGINALPAAMRLAETYHVELPIMEAVNAIVKHGADPMETVAQLMARDKKPELPHGAIQE